MDVGFLQRLQVRTSFGSGGLPFTVRRVFAALMYWEQYSCCSETKLAKKVGEKLCRILV